MKSRRSFSLLCSRIDFLFIFLSSLNFVNSYFSQNKQINLILNFCCGLEYARYFFFLKVYFFIWVSWLINWLIGALAVAISAAHTNFRCGTFTLVHQYFFFFFFTVGFVWYEPSSFVERSTPELPNFMAKQHQQRCSKRTRWRVGRRIISIVHRYFKETVGSRSLHQENQSYEIVYVASESSRTYTF